MRKAAFLPAIVLGALVSGLPASDSSQADPGEAPIRLKAGTFLPSRGEPVLPRSLQHRAIAPGQRGTYLVQFTGPIEASWKEEVAAQGATLLDYVPDFAFKVRMTPQQATNVRRLASVHWVGFFHPGYRLSPRLTRGGERLYTLQLERDADPAAAAEGLKVAGARVLSSERRTIVVSASSDRLEALAAHPDVAWVEDFVLRKKMNDQGGGVIMGAATANNSGYTGSTQTVAVADTGIGGGMASTAHAYIPSSRVSAIYNWPGTADGTCITAITDDGARDVDSGHGTHTTSSILGVGDASGRGRGTAPGANLVFQAVENYATFSQLCQLLYGYTDGYYLVGLPTDLRSLFQQAYSAGARVHSDSWGSDAAGQYTTDSVNTDDFVWGHKDMTITFSAGNAGTDADANGGVDGGSIGSPATAKNVIAVGASENDRADDYPCDATKEAVCLSQGGKNLIFTYGSAWPFNFPADPLKSDPSAGNAEQMAAFSSRGPSDDGRIKPDVVAPGTWLLSGYSEPYRSGYDPAPNPQTGLYQYQGWGYPLNGELKYLGGTSMSNPLVAGGAAVVRDYYQQVHAHAASAALVKATLVNSAVDLLDENNDGANDNALPIPNNYEGWGRVNLAAATDGSRQFREELAGVQTNGTRSYSFDVAAGTPFKVTLAWSDFPGTTSATKMLVNDLDLEVSGPGGVVYKGNVFGRGWSVTGGLRDNTNNLENVFVQSPTAGTWTVTVRAFNVPQGPQPFALVAAGQLSTAPPVTISIGDVSVAEGNSGTTAAVFTVSLSGAAGVPVTIDYATADGTAVAGTDYAAAAGTLTFAAGQTSRTISVNVNGDTAVEPDETFIVNLSNPSGATIADGQGVGTITNDDTALPPPGPQPVVWTSLVGVSASGNSLTKTAAAGWGNAGAVSTQQIASGDGYVEFTASERNTYRQLGLSFGDSNATYQDIDFAFYLAGGNLNVHENGVLKGTFGAFATGDVLRVAVVGGVVQYSRNGVVLYSSTKTPTYPLLVDTALYSTGATLKYAVILGSSSPPPPPPVQISIGDVSVVEGNSGTTNAVFTVSLSGIAGVPVTVDFATADGTALAGSDYLAATGNLTFTPGQTSKTIAVVVNGDTAVEPDETFFVNLSNPSGATIADGQGVGTITNDDTVLPPPGAQPVVWTSAIGVTVSANSLTKTAPAAWGNAGAVSTQQIASGDGYLEFTASERNTYRQLGLSFGDSNATYQDIDFAFYLAGGNLNVHENGILKGSFGAFATGDVLRVAVVGGAVQYSRNGVVLYSSTKTPTYPLLVDTALYSTGATLKNAAIAGP